MDNGYAKHIATHRKERKERLMRTAAAAFLETGLKQTTMEQVATHAGVSKIVLYRYFGSKDKLIHAILGTMVDRLLKADEVDVDWWTERIPLTLSVARENRDAMTLLIRQASHDPKYGSHFMRLHDVLVERSRQRQERNLPGELSEKKTPAIGATFLAETTVALFLEAYVRWLETGDPNHDDDFISWITRSARALSYYGAGGTPPE
ncbi:MAG: TetR/AcrR family transcriptional regulator [Robiginitomaculum sp.]|nr:TetR/AcrR family transcriptional regulator [Robiginitomaculum sp.]